MFSWPMKILTPLLLTVTYYDNVNVSDSSNPNHVFKALQASLWRMSYYSEQKEYVVLTKAKKFEAYLFSDRKTTMKPRDVI